MRKSVIAVVRAATRMRCIESHLLCSLRAALASGIGREFRQAIIDGHEEEQGEDDNCSPDDCGRAEQGKLRLVAEEKGFDEEKQEAEAVPEGHGEAEFCCEQSDDGKAGAVVEFFAEPD